MVSTSSDGFIETVVAAHHNTSTDAFYLETELQRCQENSQWNSTGYDLFGCLFNLGIYSKKFMVSTVIKLKWVVSCV